MVGKTISHYKITKKLGQGGMGEVYLADDTELDRKVALKFLPEHLTRDKENVERFRREAKAAAALNHPNIVTIFEISKSDEQIFIVMEYVNGDSLRTKIDSGILDINGILDITKQICEGLFEAHKSEIVHRDIKPENILIDNDRRVKILDFGLAKLKGVSKLTKEKSTIGTLKYMSPEQYQNKEVDHRTDIWSFGIVLFEMLTGRLPFQGEYESAVMYSVLNEEPESLTSLQDDIPQNLEQIVSKSLEKDPAMRYQSMQEVLGELKKPLSSLAVPEKKEKSIIVLPFVNMSPDPEQEYFSDGLTEEIITDLSQISSLRVISRTSSMVLKGTKKNIGQIHNELNVKYVLEGSVRKAGNNVRITAQLIDAIHDKHLWAEKYNGTLDNIFDLQEKVSLEIQAALRLSVGGDEQKRLEKRYTENIKAYDLYLKGLHLRRRLKGSDIRESIKYFEQAIEIDPDYALAYAGMAYAYLLLSFYTPVKSSDVYQAGKRAVQKALALDDKLPEAYEALSIILAYFDWDWDGAKKAGRKIVELNPSYPWGYFHLAHVLATKGQFEESIRLMNKAHRLDPLNVIFSRTLGYIYLGYGQLDTAIKITQRTIKMDSQAPTAHLYLAKAYLATRKYEEALAAIDKEKNMPQEIIEPLRGIIYTYMDRKEDASRILEKYGERPEDEFTPFYSLATLCTALGEIEQALDLLEKGYENHDVEMYRIKTDFLLDRVRSEDRFKSLIKKMKLNS